MHATGSTAVNIDKQCVILSICLVYPRFIPLPTPCVSCSHHGQGSRSCVLLWLQWGRNHRANNPQSSSVRPLSVSSHPIPFHRDPSVVPSPSDHVAGPSSLCARCRCGYCHCHCGCERRPRMQRSVGRIGGSGIAVRVQMERNHSGAVCANCKRKHIQRTFRTFLLLSLPLTRCSHHHRRRIVTRRRSAHRRRGAAAAAAILQQRRWSSRCQPTRRAGGDGCNQ